MTAQYNPAGIPPELLAQMAQVGAASPPWLQTILLVFATGATLWMTISKYLDNKRNESSEVGRVTRDLEYTQQRLKEAREETDLANKKREQAEARVQEMFTVLSEVKEELARSATEVKFLRDDVAEAKQAVAKLTEENTLLRQQVGEMLRGG